jgi:hypothetical protein
MAPTKRNHGFYHLDTIRSKVNLVLKSTLAICEYSEFEFRVWFNLYFIILFLTKRTTDFQRTNICIIILILTRRHRNRVDKQWSTRLITNFRWAKRGIRISVLWSILADLEIKTQTFWLYVQCPFQNKRAGQRKI